MRCVLSRGKTPSSPGRTGKYWVHGVFAFSAISTPGASSTPGLFLAEQMYSTTESNQGIFKETHLLGTQTETKLLRVYVFT